MVLTSIEKPMLEYILNKVGGNQSKAAEMLGLNRNTLRKKMAQYHLQ
jgi:Fis family transcriptional regulator, factor for inversion stimulation protein